METTPIDYMTRGELLEQLDEWNAEIRRHGARSYLTADVSTLPMESLRDVVTGVGARLAEIIRAGL